MLSRAGFCLLALFVCSPAFAEWTYAVVDGVRVCRNEVGEQMTPTSQSTPWASYACRNLNAAEAQGVLVRPGAPVATDDVISLELDLACIPPNLDVLPAYSFARCVMGLDVGTAKWSLSGDTVGWTIADGVLHYAGGPGRGEITVRLETAFGAIETAPLSWSRP